MEGTSRLLVSVKENKDQKASWVMGWKKINNEFSKANLGQIFYGNFGLNQRINREIYMSFVVRVTWRNCESCFP